MAFESAAELDQRAPAELDQRAPAFVTVPAGQVYILRVDDHDDGRQQLRWRREDPRKDRMYNHIFAIKYKRNADIWHPNSEEIGE